MQVQPYLATYINSAAPYKKFISMEKGIMDDTAKCMKNKHEKKCYKINSIMS